MLKPVRTVAPSPLVSAADTKAAGAIPSTTSDDLADTLIAAATDYLDGYNGILGRAIMPQTWRTSFYDWPRCRVRLPLGDLRSVESITYYDINNGSQTLGPAYYAALQDSLSPFILWNSTFTAPSVYERGDAITVTWVAGYADADSVPGPIKMAVMVKAGSILKQMTSDGVLQTETIYGVESRTFATSSSSSDGETPADKAVLALVQPYRRVLI